MLNKKTFFILILSLSVASFCFAGIKNIDKENLWEENDNEEFVIEKNKGKSMVASKDADKHYDNAKNAYWLGNFSEANMFLDAILTGSENQKANELKNKIVLIEEKESFFKKGIIGGYSTELKRTIKESNFYEGYVFLNKILKLSPKENVEYSKKRLDEDVDTVSQFLYSDKDRNLFKKSIEYFSNGKFSKANVVIGKLCNKYPKFLNFKKISESYTIEEGNDKAVEKYYKKALKAAQKGYMYQAKNYIDLAYSIKMDDIRVLVLREQIDMELM